MTFDPLTDGFSCYHEAMRALRQVALTKGAIPLDNETVDLIVLNALSYRPCDGGKDNEAE